jgi:putative heme degradation protein
MIIEDERNKDELNIFEGNNGSIQPSSSCLINFSQFIDNTISLRNSTEHYKLRNDLVKHLWSLKGKSSGGAGDQ